LRWAHKLVAIICGMRYGPTGVSIALVVSTFILFVLAIAYAGRPLGIGAKDLIAVVWRPLLASLLSAAIGFALRFTILTEMSVAVLILAYLTTYLFLITHNPHLFIIVGLLRERVLSRSSSFWQGTPCPYSLLGIFRPGAFAMVAANARERNQPF
jgi:hypothetical protein